MALVDIRLGYKNQAWFDANPTLVLKQGQAAFLEQTGRYKLGNGTTDLQTLAFLGSGGGVRFDTNTAAFPPIGEIEVIYVAKDTGLMYQWNGVAYAELSAGGSSSSNIDGGSANSIYLIAQNIDGGNA